MESTSPNASPRKPEAGRPRGHILIVDDEVFIRNAFRLYFETIGYTVLVAEGGEAALSHVNKPDVPIDVAILDLVMPGVQGLDLLKMFKARRPQMEVIIATGCGSLSSAIEAMRNGAFDYITKPIVNFDEELLKVVEDALIHRRNLEKSKLGNLPNHPATGQSEFTARTLFLFEKFIALAEMAALWDGSGDRPMIHTPGKRPESALSRLERFLNDELGISSGLLFLRRSPGHFTTAYSWGGVAPVEFEAEWFSNRPLFNAVIEGRFLIFPTEDINTDVLGLHPAGSDVHPIAIHFPLFLEGIHRGALFLFITKRHVGLKNANIFEDGRPYLLLAPLLSSVLLGSIPLRELVAQAGAEPISPATP